ncbi:hypothetical protein KAH81_02955, partial [bacterium]|nr:hypothetical protein [bacterium]
MINFKKILLLMMPFSLLFAFSYTHFEKGIPTIEVEGNYAHVELVGCDQPHPGQLDLPIRLLNVALPAQTRAVSIECLAEREVLISGIEINSVSQQEYYSNWPQFFPEHNQTAELINTGLLFGVPIAQIKLRPFTYENSNGTLFLNKRIHIDFYLERWDYRAELPVTSTQYSASVRNRILEANVANRENLPAPFIFEPMDEMESRVRSFPPALGDDPSDGVAIIADRFLPYFEAFFQDEIAFGLIIEPISLEALYSAYPHGVDRVERIRQFIVDAYQKWGISGVFLVGNIEELPVRFRYGMMAIPTWEEIPTDMYFTVMDGNWNNNADRYFGEEDEDDFLPELFVGRFQPEDTLEAIAYVQKLRSHRRELNNDFIRRWLFACASLSPTGEDQMGQLICDSIIDSHLPEGIDALKMYSHFDLTGGDIELNETNFRSQLYSGRYLICHIDHGYQYILHTGKESGGGGLNIGDFLSLDNHPFFPILYTYSCEVNAIDLSSIGAASIRSTEGGLVAIIAHSRAAWTSQVNLVYYFWINNVFPYKSIKLGEILQNIFLTLADNSVYRYYKCITTLFGYPFLDVYPQGLSEVDLSFSRDSIPSEGGILTVTVLNSLTSSPIGDVSIVARTPGGKFATDITNEYGIVRLYIRPGEAEYVYISASGGGAFFTEETLAVAEPLQAYPIIERAVFHPLGGDGDTIFEPGDTFACDLSIKNCGASTADTVKFTLTSCPTLDSVAFVYSFTSFDTLTIHSAFSITAPSDCRGITNLRPVVRIESDSLFYSDTLSIYIEAPIFHHFSTEYRGGAASPFPGDTAIILLGVTNTGFGDFRGGDVDFVVSGATIDVSSYAIGTIEPLDTFILPLNLVSESIHIDGKAIFDFSNCSPETIDFDLKTPSVPDSVGMDPSVSSVELYWASPDDGLIYGYNIYRRDYTGSSLWTKLNTFPISFGTYIDEGLPEVTQFFYRVTSVSESMIESPPSDSILAWTTLTALDGWPRSIGPSIRIFASPVLYDFNDDGASEIIITGQNYSGVFALYANGEDVFDSTDAVDPFGD